MDCLFVNLSLTRLFWICWQTYFGGFGLFEAVLARAGLAEGVCAWYGWTAGQAFFPA
jgi:hypothetical protein